MEISRKDLIYLYFCIIDIMFLPYLFHLPIKLSMFILLYWFIKSKNRRVTINVMIFGFIGVLSVLIGLLKSTVDTSVIITDIQALIIILYGYLGYEYIIEKSYADVDFTGIFLSFIYISAAFMLMYWVAPSLFFKIRPIWTLQRTGEVFVSYGTNRFTSLVSEPNNMAAITVAVMAFLLFKGKTTKAEKIVVMAVSLCLVISTSSISGTFYYFCVLAIYLIFSPKRFLENYEEIPKWRKMLTPILFLITIIGIIYIVLHINTIFGSSLLKTATGRYDLYFTDTGTDMSGARSEIWEKYITSHNIFEYILIGDASVGKPHSGHLYLIYAFGLIFYFKFLRIFLFEGYKDFSSIMIRFVLLGVFSLNTLIVDLRSFVIFALLLGITSKYAMQEDIIEWQKD